MDVRCVQLDRALEQLLGASLHVGRIAVSTCRAFPLAELLDDLQFDVLREAGQRQTRNATGKSGYERIETMRL